MISVIIPLYNKENSIITSIHSVLNQSYDDIEIVIIDDGSTDNSPNLVASIADTRIRLFRQENGGPSKARNTGIENIRGEWALFLDADDKLLPGALQSFIKIQGENPDYNCFAFDFLISKDGKYTRFYNKKGVRIFKNPLKGWSTKALFPRAGSTFFRKDVLNRFFFNDSLRRFEDAEWLFRIMREEHFVRSENPIMMYCTSSAEASKKRKDISEDFMGHLVFAKKTLWEQVALYQFLMQTLKTYPDEAMILYRDIDISMFRLFVIKLLNRYCSLVIRIRSLASKLQKV